MVETQVRANRMICIEIFVVVKVQLTTRALTMLTLFGNRTDLGKDRFPAAVKWPEGIAPWAAAGRAAPERSAVAAIRD